MPSEERVGLTEFPLGCLGEWIERVRSEMVRDLLSENPFSYRGVVGKLLKLDC